MAAVNQQPPDQPPEQQGPDGDRLDEVIKRIHVRYRPRVILDFAGEVPEWLIPTLRKQGRIVVRKEDVSPAQAQQRTNLLISNGPKQETIDDLTDNFPYAAIIRLPAPPGTDYVEPDYKNLLHRDVGFDLLSRPQRFVQFVDRILTESEERRQRDIGEHVRKDVYAAYFWINAFLTKGDELSDHEKEEAYETFRSLYFAREPEGHMRTVMMRFNISASEEGVVAFGGALALPKGVSDYGLVLKRASRLRGTIAKSDSEYFGNNYPDFPIEKVYVCATSKKHSPAYVWKELVPGPTLGSLLANIQGDGNPRLLKRHRTFRHACIEVALKRVAYWHKYAPIVAPNKESGLVVDGYLRTLDGALHTASRRLRAQISNEEDAIWREGIEALEYPEFITEETLARRLDPTFLNMVYRIPDQSYTRRSSRTIIKQIFRECAAKDNSFDVTKFERSITHVDTSDRYGHILEDMLEVLEAPESNLSPEDVLKHVKRQIVDDNVVPAALSELVGKGIEAMGFYRNMRRIILICDSFAPDVFMEHGGEGGFEKIESRYKRALDHHFDHARYWLRQRAKMEKEKIEASLKDPNTRAWYASLPLPINPVLPDHAKKFILPEEPPENYTGEQADYHIIRGGMQRMTLFYVMEHILQRFKSVKKIDYFTGERNGE